MKTTEFLQHLGMQFRLERTRQRLTQRELAAKAGLVQQTINAVEKGVENTRIVTLHRIATALGLSIKEIL